MPARISSRPPQALRPAEGDRRSESCGDVGAGGRRRRRPPGTASVALAHVHLRRRRARELAHRASLGPRPPSWRRSGRLSVVPATILDGKATAAAIRAELTERVAALAAAGHRPGLGTLLVGDDPGSRWYVNAKHHDCAQVGIASIQRELPATATQADVLAVVAELNADPACTGYIVQLPLPRQHRRVRRPRGDGPGQGRRRAAPGQPRPAGAQRPRRRCRARRSASWSCCAATTCRSPAPRSSSSAAGSPSAGRSGCCSPAAPRTPP